MRTPRDAYPGAQTCCALKSSAPSGARQDNYADSGSACKLAAGHGPDGAHANRFAYPAVEKFCPANSEGPPKNFRTLYGLKWATSVEKRHRLPISEALRCPRERIKFSFEGFQIPSRICLRIQPLKNSAGRVPQAADGACNKISQIRSCRSPRTV